MVEVQGDLFRFPRATWLVIPTNGCWSDRDGRAVMGSGVALEARQRWPELARLLGVLLRSGGNRPHMLLTPFQTPQRQGVWSFPTKWDWRKPSSLPLIHESARLLAEWAAGPQCNPKQLFALPRVGTGRGGLRWDDVRQSIAPLFDDRFLVVSP